jgi:hypothetical protein
MQTFMRRILLLSLLAALAAVAAPASAWAKPNAAGGAHPTQYTNSKEHAKAIRPQLLCIRSAPQLRKAGPPDSESPDPPVIADAPDVEVQWRVALAREARQPPSLLRARSHSPRAPPASA